MLKFSAHEYPYPSQRQSVFAQRGMVAASQPLAAQAGIEVMQKGGNAIDAAIATAAALTVVEPTGCGIGGDAFALVWCKGQLHGLNGNGHAPAALSIEAVKAAGHDQMPLYGWTPVTVPGCPSAWAELSQRFGKLPFAELLQPAIRLARDGFPLSPVVAHQWQLTLEEFSPHRDAALDAWFDTFLIDGRAPRAGDMFRNPAQARTLEELAATRCESLYRGALAERLDAHSRASGGYLRASDLQDYRAEWVEPIHVNYRGVDVWEIPPSGQGLVALMALKILEGFSFDHRDSQQTWHRQLEAMKLAYSDGLHYITDPLHMRVAVADLLSDDYSSRRRGQIGEQAQPPKPGDPHASGTVYLATADAEGNMVSFIQSNYHGFGSGVVLPDSGIALQNRGQEFSLDPTHANCLAPGKKNLPHHHPRLPHPRRPGPRPVRRDGRLHAAPGPRADGDEPGGFRPQPASGIGRAALAMAGRHEGRYRTGCLPRLGQCLGAARASGADGQRPHRLRAWADHSAGPGQWCIVRRNGAEGGFNDRSVVSEKIG